MIAELGQVALALALCLSLVQGTLPLIGAANGNVVWIALARPAARGQFLCVALAFGLLGYSFIVNDFSILNVATNSNSALPLQYRIAATWGSHEGSLLLWTLMLTAWGVAVSIFSRRLPDEMVARVLGVIGLVSVGFLTFMLFTSNPFDRLLPAASDGRDLNPLLQDAGMIFHPPMLYMGYVGFSVVFAFAIAALLSGRLDAAWARWSRPWATVAWLFLTIGIALGSFWAYYELGWGGWWFWDPVENASFMPWLVGTALIHSLAITEKRGAFRSWTVLLAIATFSLSLLGTFLVRSGVLTSVHAFATDPKRGVFVLAFLVLVIGTSLTLYAWRAPRIGIGGDFRLVSRETALLTNNVLLATACGSVMLGTLYPLALDALGLGKISVGPPYFEAVFVPLMAPAIFLMGIGPMLRWKEATLPELATRLRWAALTSLIAAILVPLAMGRWTWLGATSLLFAAWITTTSVVGLRQRLRSDGSGDRLAQRMRRVPSSFYGMHLAHLGVAVFIVGVTLVGSYQSESDVKMKIDDHTTLAGYQFLFNDIREIRGPNYIAARGTIVVSRDGKPVTSLHPEKRVYLAQNMPMTEAAIDRGVTRDIYVAMGEELSPGTWIVRIWHKPFVNWIWVGCVIMALGGLMAASDRRYRAGRTT